MPFVRHGPLGRRVLRLAIAAATFAMTARREAAAQARRFELTDLANVATLGEVTFAPDGRSMLVPVRRPNYETNQFDTELRLVYLRSGDARPLAGDWRGASNFAFAANGRLAWLAPVQGSVRQVWVAAGPGSPAAAITRAPAGVDDFAWSPDGSVIAYLTREAPAPRRGAERFDDAFVVGNDPYLTTAPPRPAELWLVPSSGGEARRLTSGDGSLATSLDQSPISWSPDGRRIALQRFASPHSGDTDKSTVLTVDVTTGASSPVATDGGRKGEPSYSRDGKWIAYYAPRGGKPENLRDLFLAPVGGGAARNVSEPLDRAVSGMWMADGSLLLVGPEGTRSALWLLDPGSGESRALGLGDVVEVASVAVSASGAIAFVGSERGRPQELYAIDSPGQSPRRLTNVNETTAKLALGRTEGIRWTSTDGLSPDGVVTYPPDFQEGRRYPLVVFAHGGPTASSLEGFAARPQLFAAQGWIVLQPNYRGSDNLGNAFQAAIARNPGDGIGADVMAGVRALINRGIVDTTRLAVSGWSFGGYVSAWMLGHSTQWRAAVVGAAATDFFDMYALTDLNVMLRHALTSSPYAGDREEYFRRQSPLTYATKVRTPTLILHDVYDQRVVIGQSYKLFHALRDNGVETEFVAYPIAAHSPSDPIRYRDVTRRWIEWLAKYLR